MTHSGGFEPREWRPLRLPRAVAEVAERQPPVDDACWRGWNAEATAVPGRVRASHHFRHSKTAGFDRLHPGMVVYRAAAWA